MLVTDSSILAKWKNGVEFLEIISKLSNLPIAVWRTGEPLSIEKWTNLKDGQHPCFTWGELRSSLDVYCRDDRPTIFLESDQVFYGIVPLDEFSLAIGPAALWTLSEAHLQKYAATHRMEKAISIPMKDPETIARLMGLIHLHFIGSSIAYDEIPLTNQMLEEWQSEGALEEYQLSQSENDRDIQMGIDYENQLVQAVKEGNLTALRTLLTGPAVDYSKIGELSGELGKVYEYLIVSVIGLCTRAAVEGGVNAEAAYQLGDVYLRRLSKAVVQHDSYLTLGYRAMIEFTELVKRSREERSYHSYVNACKEFIERNLRKDLKVGDIAPAIGVSRTYLSRLFHQEEGITLQQYIQKEKCRHASQMLRYSDHSIAEIAAYLGFSSQSYFGSCFQHWHGVTPSVYRRKGSKS